ncbi:MAG: transcriptional repressor [Desulfobacterales bacterium]|nr:transcriptional repressor [Desulfobacterales bacterium]
MEGFIEQCKSNGLKVTPQRMAVYRALEGSTAHPSADHIHKELLRDFPGISLDTVNRTLLTFAKIGIVDVVEGHGDPRRFDPNLGDHHHFYCLGCREIYDFHSSELEGMPHPEDLPPDFNITGKRICLSGYCKDCRDNTPK